MMRRMSAQQFMMWQAYEALEPFGEQRDDYRAATICKVVADVNRASGQQAYAVERFLLKFNEAEQAGNSRQQQISIIKAIALAYSARGQDM